MKLISTVLAILSLIAVTPLSTVEAATGDANAAGHLTGDQIAKLIVVGQVSMPPMLGTAYDATVRFDRNGTMSGVLPRAHGDSGTWWTEGDRFCYRWRDWEGGAIRCYGIAREGSKLKLHDDAGAVATTWVLDWRAVSDWEKGGGATPLPGEPAPRPSFGTRVSTGTGFVVNRDGYLTTNYHVVDGCDRLSIVGRGNERFQVSVVVTDKTADLALLKAQRKFDKAVVLRIGRFARMGEEVVVYGFPLPSLMGEGGKLTTGIVSALFGEKDNANLIQISAQIQPGNSGGPVFDRSGNLIAVVRSGLNAITVAQLTGGRTPQNVNYSIKVNLVQNLLDAQGIDYEAAQSKTQLSIADVADRAVDATFLVECWR